MKQFSKWPGSCAAIWFLLGATCSVWDANAQSSPPPVTRNLAFTGATIVARPGSQPVQGAVVIRNGVIQAVGPNLALPAGARQIAADSLYLYAGFISGFSHVGVPQKEEAATGGGRQRLPEGVSPGAPPDALAGIEPDKTLLSALDPKDKGISALREAGFTAAVSAPRGKMLPGKTGVVLLGGDTPQQLLYLPETGVALQMVPAQGVYPNTVMGIMAKYRDLYYQAVSALDHEKRYAANPAGMERPTYPAAVRAMFPVVEKQIPVIFRADEVKNAYRALALQTEMGYRMILVELSGAQELIPALQQQKIPVFLSLNLPEAPKDSRRPDKDTVEYDSLEARKERARIHLWGQSAAFARAGLPFGFSTLNLKPKDFFNNLNLMGQLGLTDQHMLAALTTDAARLLGLDQVMGAVEPGKMANLVLLDKPLGDPAAKVRFVVIDGIVFDLGGKKPGGKADPSLKLAGKWTYTVESPQGANSGELTLKAQGEDYSGAIYNERMGASAALDELEVDGNALTFSYQVGGGGRSLKVIVNAKIVADQMEGTMSVGEFGSFPFKATRIGDPD